MKVSTLMPFLAIVTLLSFTSCSTENFEDDIEAIELTTAPQAKEIEIEILELINNHRLTNGLSALGNHDTVKAVAFTHTDYMIEVSDVSHDNFYQRKVSLEANAGARVVSENVGYGFSTAHSVVNAWLNSPAHKANLEGDFTDFDVSAEQDENGRWYFTNIFIKR
ncbi:CAP domain-containing protein [Winogradskyella immobilis]|uniref:CAP domain-containing protein n=1 Tax=Winogradskyella immobilis TaxID=2816852 RepID=A0ABS8EKM1_9FLAO|nr:CAP domain-containing protein [Winogradskyella immobilis]MCC1483753.1 CAP domain-containing protein [Winogradskyella immobilis]MCG0015847.1 CAP domain-containing protein [Winogradskyella immobilis]